MCMIFGIMYPKTHFRPSLAYLLKAKATKRQAQSHPPYVPPHQCLSEIFFELSHSKEISVATTLSGDTIINLLIYLKLIQTFIPIIPMHKANRPISAINTLPNSQHTWSASCSTERYVQYIHHELHIGDYFAKVFAPMRI